MKAPPAQVSDEQAHEMGERVIGHDANPRGPWAEVFPGG